jgi:lipopolysaccharide export system protein LptA
MTWQRTARLAVAGVGLTTALAVVLLVRERPAQVDPGVTTPVDPGATMQAGSGVDTRHRGDERIGVIAYDEITHFKDGRTGYKNARVTLKDGTVLSAGLAETVGKAASGESPAAEYRLRNGVRLTKPGEGTTLAGESGSYSETTGEASIPGAVTFSRGRMAGRGTGGVYSKEDGSLRVLADVVVTLQVDPPGKPIEARSATMTFTPATRSMLFDRNARITRESEVLSGDRAVLFLSDNDEHFRAIELRGHASVVPAPGAANGLADMRADDIDLGFHDGGQALRQAALNGRARLVQSATQGGQTIEAPRVDLTMAPDGQTLTDLRAGPTGVTVRLPAVETTPARTIEAATLAATGTDKSGLLNAVFTDAVRFTEQAPAAPGRAASERVGRSRVLTLVLAGTLNALKTATFRQNVTFEATSANGKTTGDADQGVYDAGSGQLVLTPFTLTKTVRPPRVTDGDGVTVDATGRIVTYLNTNSLEAHENVNTSSKGQGKGSARGFFTPGQPVRGSSAVFTRDNATKVVKYTGTATAPAWVQQGTGDSRIEGHEIEMHEETGDMKASGRIKSTVVFDSAPAGRGAAAGTPTPARYDISAETMIYDEKQRTATYAGAPVVLKRPNGETRSRRVVITLARDERRLERLEATDEVTAKLEGGGEAKGTRLLYEAATDRYTVRGAPVLVRTRDEAGTCSLARGQVVHFTGTGRNQDWPEAENPGGSIAGPYSCTEPLP